MGERGYSRAGWYMNRLILLCIGASASVWGQDAPGRVGRVSFVYGDVSAGLNEPLTNGDHLRTGADSQAEVYVGAPAGHLAPQTDFSVVLLDNLVFRMALTAGALNVRIPRLNEAEVVEVDTARGSFRLLGAGSYRLDAQPGFVSIAVRSGSAQAMAAGRTYA